MYNNFLSKKSKKAISALLASALVITAAPINAEAATTKTLGVGKSFTVTAASAKSKITGLSAAEKKIVSVTRKNSKSKVYTIKAKTAGKVTFKIGAKTVKVNAGATKIFRNGSSKVTVTAGKYTNLDVRTAYGKGDTLTFTSSNSKVASIVKGKTTAKVKYNKSNSITKNTKALKAVKAGKATITIKSKNTGKSYKLYVTVKAATPKATATPVVTTNAPATPVVTETAPATTTAAAVTETPVATATAPAVTASAPAVTSTPVPTTGATITSTPVATATATAPAVTETPVQTATAPAVTQTPAPTETPSVVSASVVSASAVNTQDEVTPLTAVTKNGKLKITFNKAIKESTVNNTTFTVTDEKGKNISLPASDVALEIGGKTVSVDLKNIGLEKNATYKLTVKGVVDAEGFAAVDYTTDFTVAGTAIIQSVRLSSQDDADELSTNMYTGAQYRLATPDEKNDNKINKYVKNQDGTYTVDPNGTFVETNGTWAGKVIKVKYDALLDATTVNAANIELTNTTTGERIPVTYVTSPSDGEITITAKSTLITKNLYKLTIKGVKTAVNGNAEGLTHVFTVNGVKPFETTGATYRTIDGKAVVNNTYVWPMLAAGNKETALNDSEYFAGLQINVTAAETLDAATVEKCVYLVEKETKEIVAATVSYNAESKMITIIPKANLKEDTDYQIQYLGGLRTTDFVYLDSNKKNDVVTNQTVDFRTMDATAPEVVSIVAKSGTSGLEVAKAQEFIVTFSESVTLRPDATQILLTETSKDVESEEIGSEDVEVAVVAGTDSKQWTLKIPAGTLEANKSYKLRVLGKDAKDWASVKNADTKIVNDGYGYTITVIDENNQASQTTRQVPNRLKKTATYTFSTENDTTAPSLVAVYAGDDITDESKIIKETKTNVSEEDKFTFVFDEEVQFKPGAVVRTEKLVNGSWVAEKDNVQIAPAKNKDNEVIGFTVTPGCDDDAKYRIVIDKGVVKDNADRKDPSKCNEFDLYRYELIGTEGDDVSTAISMIANTGVNGEYAALANDNVKVNSRFFIGLEEKDTTGISDKNLSLLDSEGNKVAGEIKEVTSTDAVGALKDTNKLGVTNSKTIYVFIPSKDLAFESTYTLVLENVKDAIGNTIEKKAITFKTAADVTRVSSIEGVKDGEVSVNRTGVFKINFNNKNTELIKNADNTLVAGEVEIRNKVDDSVFTGYELKADTDKKVYTISFTGADDAHKLAANTTYVLKVKLADVDGKANEASVTFTTGLDAKDIVKPEVSTIKVDGRTITKDATNSLKIGNGTITLTYDEEVNKDDVKVEITNVAESNKTATVLNITKDKNKLTIETAGMSRPEAGSVTTYKVVISGVKDTAKNEADSITFFLKDDLSVNDNADANTKDIANADIKTVADAYVKALTAGVASGSSIKFTQPETTSTVTISTPSTNNETTGNYDKNILLSKSDVKNIKFGSGTNTGTSYFSVEIEAASGTKVNKYFKVVIAEDADVVITEVAGASVAEAAKTKDDANAKIATEKGKFDTSIKSALTGSSAFTASLSDSVTYKFTASAKNPEDVLDITVNDTSLGTKVNSTDSAKVAYVKVTFSLTDGDDDFAYYKITVAGKAAANVANVVAASVEEIAANF